jgi:hypothetical protein
LRYVPSNWVMVVDMFTRWSVLIVNENVLKILRGNFVYTSIARVVRASDRPMHGG